MASGITRRYFNGGSSRHSRARFVGAGRIRGLDRTA